MGDRGPWPCRPAPHAASLTLVGVMALLLAVVSAARTLPWNAYPHDPACQPAKTRRCAAASRWDTGAYVASAAGGFCAGPVASAAPVAFLAAAALIWPWSVHPGGARWLRSSIR